VGVASSQLSLQLTAEDSKSTDVKVGYSASATRISRIVEGSFGSIESWVDRRAGIDGTKIVLPSEQFDLNWLNAKAWPELTEPRATLLAADLFCGSGGLSLGAWEACRALGLSFKSAFAVDNDEDAINVYRRNFAPKASFCAGIESMVGDTLGAATNEQERTLLKSIGPIDLVLAGPPCQGHSDLNNFTRRQDPRNSLIHRVVRFVELLQPKHVIVENVQGIRHDRSGAFQLACANLRQLGYEAVDFLLDAQLVGVPQKRRRCFIVASREGTSKLARLIETQSVPVRTFDWACADLDGCEANGIFDTSAKVSTENQRRMNYLIDHQLYELPNEERPDCHRLKKHDYASVYGRLHGDMPAPTITTGFGSPGQGRYTHPRFARTITPHEAARLQFIPDFFDFGLNKRKRLQKLIGNAVPSKLGYAIIFDILSQSRYGS